MDLDQEQRRILASADTDGRVFTRRDRKVAELVEEGYLEESAYHGGCYHIRKTADGKAIKR